MEARLISTMRTVLSVSTNDDDADCKVGDLPGGTIVMLKLRIDGIVF